MGQPISTGLHIPVFDLADRMRKALRNSGLTVTDMAEYLGISRETAGRYMNGHGKVPLQTVRLWALRTGVPFEWLETGKVPSDNPPAPKKTRARKTRSLDYKADGPVLRPLLRSPDYPASDTQRDGKADAAPIASVSHLRTARQV